MLGSGSWPFPKFAGLLLSIEKVPVFGDGQQPFLGENVGSPRINEVIPPDEKLLERMDPQKKFQQSAKPAEAKNREDRRKKRQESKAK